MRAALPAQRFISDSGSPPRASPQLRLQTGPLSPERDGIRTIFARSGRQRRRRRQPRTKLRHSLTLYLFTAHRPAHARVHQARFPSLSRRRRSEPPAVSEQSKRDSRSVGAGRGGGEHDVGRGGRHEWGSSWRERKSESEPAKERGWCPRQTGSHEEILHTQRLSISMFEEEREDPRAQGSAKRERKGGTESRMKSGIPPVRWSGGKRW